MVGAPALFFQNAPKRKFVPAASFCRKTGITKGGTHMNGRILVVDDEAAIADLVEVYLKKRGV